MQMFDEVSHILPKEDDGIMDSPVMLHCLSVKCGLVVTDPMGLLALMRQRDLAGSLGSTAAAWQSAARIYSAAVAVFTDPTLADSLSVQDLQTIIRTSPRLTTQPNPLWLPPSAGGWWLSLATNPDPSALTRLFGPNYQAVL